MAERGLPDSRERLVGVESELETASALETSGRDGRTERTSGRPFTGGLRWDFSHLSVKQNQTSSGDIDSEQRHK